MTLRTSSLGVLLVAVLATTAAPAEPVRVVIECPAKTAVTLAATAPPEWSAGAAASTTLTLSRASVVQQREIRCSYGQGELAATLSRPFPVGTVCSLQETGRGVVCRPVHGARGFGGGSAASEAIGAAPEGAAR